MNQQKVKGYHNNAGEREGDVEVLKCAENESERNKTDREREQAEERCMETIGETMERDGRGTDKKRESSAEIGDLMEYLRKKVKTKGR